MKIAELNLKLQKLGIPKSIYNLRGDISNPGTVLYKNYNKWEVIHVGDKGEQKIVKEFNKEEDACKFILDGFVKYSKISNPNFKPESSKTDRNDDDLPDVIFL
ncbi:hypothetical protein [Mariniflexile sp.]|uniref:hypothetical protein n=1 Tax=Mariniflexile sp. TaxID=1979402 RepID=UPI00404869C4